MADWPTPEEEEAMFLALLERLEQGLEEPDIQEPGDPMDGPIPMDSEEVEQAFKDGDIEALYRSLSARDGQNWLDRLSRFMDSSRHGSEGAKIKMKNTADVHEEWRDQARQYFEDYPESPIKDAVDYIYKDEVLTWEFITDARWKDTKKELEKQNLDYSKAFGKVPKPRSKNTIWAVIADLAPKNKE